MIKRVTPQEREEQLICESSIERVINTTLHLLKGVQDKELREELRHINLDDWTALKEITVRLWNEERNRIFLRRLEEQTHLQEITWYN